MSLNMLPLVAFDRIPDAQADQLLVAWGHWLSGCNRPFGRQSFGLQVADLGIVSVAVSASTVSDTCGTWERQEIVELARLASHPDHRWASRVCLRLWREVAADCWTYWPVKALVSYSNNTRHKGDLYRFDGWRRVGGIKGRSTGGGTWSTPRPQEPKTLWVWELAA